MPQLIPVDHDPFALQAQTAPAPQAQATPQQQQPQGLLGASAADQRMQALIDRLPGIGAAMPEFAKGIMEHPAYKQAQKAAEIQQRVMTAQQFGMDPRSPEGREYVLTGSIPKFERNFPAIQKADENVVSTENSIAKAKQAIELNRKTTQGPMTSLRAKIGGWFNNDAAMATQEYQSIAGLLSQEIAKGLSGGGRVNAIEQKMMKDLLGGIDQPREVRERILGDVIQYLDHKRAFTARQAEELRNGTYYQPRRPQQQQQSSPDLSKVSTEDLLKALGNGR